MGAVEFDLELLESLTLDGNIRDARIDRTCAPPDPGAVALSL
jgi:hypothetical protein